MIQELFHIGPLPISPFGVLLVAAFVGAFLQLRWGLRRLEIGDDEDANALLFAAGVGGIVGGKVYYAILYQDWRLLLNRSGLVWYGGLILGTLAVLLTLRLRRLPGWATADAAAPSLALGYAVGRLGCFFVGDDYGVPTELPWGVAFPVGPVPTKAGWLRSEFGIDVPAEIPGDELLAVHPTQLYETLTCLGIWFVGVWLLRRGAGRGRTALLTLGLLGLERFGVEFLRAKDDRWFGGFTLAQLLSVAVVAVVVGVWLARRRAGGVAEAS